MRTQIISLSLVAAFAAISLAGKPVEADTALACGSHDKLVNVLSERFKEKRQVLGLVSARAVMEVFISSQGTWTILITDTNGTSCVTAAGNEWQEVPVAVAGLDS